MTRQEDQEFFDAMGRWRQAIQNKKPVKISTPWGVRKIEALCAVHEDLDAEIVGRTNDCPSKWVYQCETCDAIWIEGQGVQVVPDDTPETYE